MNQPSRNFIILIFSMLIILFGFHRCHKGEKASSDHLQTSGSDDLETTLLLSHYRPRSIYRIPRTRIEKARYPVIDVHSHAYAECPEDIAHWVKNMDNRGIRKAVLLTMATGTEFDSLVSVYGRYPDRFELWCGFDYTGYDQPGFGPEAVDELERCVRQGAKGVGELGDKGKGLYYSHPTQAWGMHLDDPRMDALLSKCGEMGLPVNIHVAEPVWMYEPMDSTNDGLMNAYKWRLDNQPGIVGHSEMIDILERAVKRHPGTRFIASHYANLTCDLSRLGRLFDLYPNLYADISARFIEIGQIPRFVSRFYTTYQDRLLYGTDWGTSPEMYALTFRILETEDEHFYGFEYGFNSRHHPIHGLGLNDNILHKVYQTNAQRIFN